jgi:hypothetical protein
LRAKPVTERGRFFYELFCTSSESSPGVRRSGAIDGKHRQGWRASRNAPDEEQTPEPTQAQKPAERVSALTIEPLPEPVAQVAPAPPVANGHGATTPPPASPPPTAPQSVFEPPEGRLFEAISKNKGLIAICAIACAVIGAVYGYTRPVTYEAAATLQIGQVNPNSPGFASYTQSASSLATAFSRSVTAEPVLQQIEDKLEIPPQKAARRLSAEPVPLSPIFRVIATGPSPKGAKELADVAAAGVISYAEKSNSANPQAGALLTSYRQAALKLRKAKAEAEALGKDKKASPEKRLKAEARQSAAQVKLKAIGAAYVATVTSQPPREGFVSLLSGAATASGDRKSTVQMYGFVGLLAGIVLGCAAASLRERRRRGRALAGA